MRRIAYDRTQRISERYLCRRRLQRGYKRVGSYWVHATRRPVRGIRQGWQALCGGVAVRLELQGWRRVAAVGEPSSPSTRYYLGGTRIQSNPWLALRRLWGRSRQHWKPGSW